MNPIPEPKHIVVACLENPAKLLTALPVFQTLKTAFPRARTTALVDSGSRAMLQGHPAVDAVEAVSAEEGFWRLAGRMRGWGADVFINLYPRPKPLLAAWKAKIPARVGMGYKWHGFLQTHTVRADREVSDRNEVEYHFELLKPLGIGQFAKRIEFPLSEAQKAWGRDFLAKNGIAPGTPYVIVHPGSKGRVLHWKAEKYGQLLGYLCQVKGLKVVLTAAPGEASQVGEAMAGLFALEAGQKPVLVETRELELSQLAALCQGAQCVLSGPLGPMHLAAAVGTPTVTIFSPAPEATPVRWGAWGNENTVLIPQNPLCNSCRVGYCKKHDPMEALSVMEVLEAVKKYVRRAVAV